jgi:hypothetical protein
VSYVSEGIEHAGDLTRPPAAPWTPAVHALLRHLDAVGFSGAPRVVRTGIDADGWETVEFLPGDVDSKRVWNDEGLHELGQLLRRLHRATASFRPPPDAIWQADRVRPRRRRPRDPDTAGNHPAESCGPGVLGNRTDTGVSRGCARKRHHRSPPSERSYSRDPRVRRARASEYPGRRAPTLVDSSRRIAESEPKF